MGFPGGLAVKNLPARQESQEMQVQSLGRKDLLEEGMETHFSILAWRTPWTEEPVHEVAKESGSGSRTQLKRLITHTHV